MGYYKLLLLSLQVTAYRLPKHPEERQRWIKAIPRDNIPDREDTVVCANHFPVNFEVVKVKGKERPNNPPSIFDNIKKSLIPTPPPAKQPKLQIQFVPWKKTSSVLFLRKIKSTHLKVSVHPSHLRRLERLLYIMFVVINYTSSQRNMKTSQELQNLSCVSSTIWLLKCIMLESDATCLHCRKTEFSI